MLFGRVEPPCLVALGLIAQLAVAAEPAVPPLKGRTDARGGNGLERMLNDALGLIGVRYRLGGESADEGFDCSGLVVHLFREAGIELPRTAREISRTGAPVRKADLEPGDIVFFNTLPRAYSHVGIYLGDNQFVHAPRPGGAVRIDDLRKTYWAHRYTSARRVGGS